MKDAKRKKCSKCGSIKPLSEFTKDSTRADGHRSECRECHNARGRTNWRNWDSAKRSQATAEPYATCLCDPTGMYSGNIDRRSFAGTLYDGYWPDGSVWLLSYPRTAKRTRWRLRGRALYEIGGQRVVKALGGPYAPALKIVDAAQAADD